MQKRIYLILSSILFLSYIITGCNDNKREITKLVEERDSLRQLNESQSALLDNYGQAIEILNATLDSITLQENLIFFSQDEVPVTKESVKQNLDRFETLLKKQEEKINLLEARLAASNDSASQSLRLIAHLREQIETKNIQIAQLKNELEKKNVSIAQLQEYVESQQIRIESQVKTINELNQRTEKQEEALARQDAILNNGYVLIGSKSDLKRKGIIQNGKLVPNAALDRSKFYKIDIREWREVSFQAKRPRILTDMPSSAYELTTIGNKSYTLHVINPSDFWRISNYLVIQTD